LITRTLPAPSFSLINATKENQLRVLHHSIAPFNERSYMQHLTRNNKMISYVKIDPQIEVKNNISIFRANNNDKHPPGTI
jgi:hypothetical protein